MHEYKTREKHKTKEKPGKSRLFELKNQVQDVEDIMERSILEEIIEEIKSADMVLVGLGEEFDCVSSFCQTEMFEEGKSLLMKSKESALVPAWQSLYREEQSGKLTEGLMALANILKEKNYFVISVSTNSEIVGIPWREGRLVMPCGTDLSKQCSSSCEDNLKMLSDREKITLGRNLEVWREKLLQGKGDCLPEGLGTCPKCKAQVELNNIYSEYYDENGYLPAWQFYTKWLQGTVNRKLVVLELGVGMKFPSVIRFPFEKISYFNQKAKFYRINKKLYHLTEELAGKGIGIADNAIDWLQNLC